MYGLVKYLIVLVFLFIFTNPSHANQTIPIEIDGGSYQLKYWPSYFANEIDIQFMDTPNTEVSEINIKFFRGEIIGHPDSLITLSQVDDKLKGLAFFYDKYYEITGSMQNLSDGEAPIAAMLSTEVAVSVAQRMTHDMCPIHTSEHYDMQMRAMAAMSMITNGFPPVAFAVGNVSLVADVALALDPPYVSFHGGETNAVINALQILDQADMFYRQAKPINAAGGLGIALHNVSIRVFSSTLPFNVADIVDPNPSLANGNQPEIDASAYLNRVQINGNALFGSIRTVGAVITGFDLDDSVVGDGVAGLSFLATSCSSLGVSISEGWSIAPVVIVAHEIGHNFGSCHDGDAASAFCPVSSVGCPAASPYIMALFVSPAATQFSACSIANICSHINVQTCYKQPIDIQILQQSVLPSEANALTQGDTSLRTFNVGNMTDVALTSVNILGALKNLSDPNNTNAEYTVVTLDGNTCTIAPNLQNYTCAIASIDANNTQTFIIIETVTATGIGQFMSTTQYKNIATEQRVDVEPQNSIVQLTHSITVAVTPPAAPSNVQATSLSTGNIQVSWADSSNNEQAFIIERSEDGGTVFNVIQADQAANTTSYIDTNVIEGQTYTYKVSASNSIGTTAAANTPNATSSTSISVVAAGGGGGAFYLMTLFLLLARTLTKFR